MTTFEALMLMLTFGMLVLNIRKEKD
ncbi:putative holin-like toxin [Cytobacillus oceanisediminis]